MRERATASAAALAILVSARGAGAQLHASIDRLAGAWRGAGAAVVIDRTRFLNDDETVAIALPELPAGECTTVVLLGGRGMGFHVQLGEGREDETNAHIPSEAGALSLERCGATMPRRLLVTSDSGRGAFETIFARSPRPLESLRSVLPERASGSSAPAAEPGLLPPMPLPERRAELAEARERRDGATVESRETWLASADGGGADEEVLEPGCHAILLFAVDPRTANPTRRTKLDLDAEMRDASGDRILARDRSDAPDARLDLCVGETTRVEVAFAGSPADAPVLVAHVLWSLPDRLPTAWGVDARARMARVLLTRHVHSLLREPVLLAQGGSGKTPVPLPIEAGACYLALVAVVQGASRAVNLHVWVGMHDTFDDRGVDENGAVVAFCAGARTSARAEIEAHGTPLLGWGLTLYRVAAGAWEVPP